MMPTKPKMRANPPKMEATKLAHLNPETFKTAVSTHAYPKMKFVSQAELALIATVLDFTSDD